MSLIFLHTAEVHVATFEDLVSQTDSSIQAKHAVSANLLEDARRLGADNPEVIKAVESKVSELVNSGATLIVCTCSTIGDIVESMSSANFTSQRIDRAMADMAVNANEETRATKISVIAALESTLKPTEELINSSATAQNKAIDLSLHHISDAWQHFEAGDNERYWQTIAKYIESLPQTADVIVLAQASMANAANYCPEVKTPILSSPLLSVQKALSTLSKL